MKERKLTGAESLNEIWNDIFLNAIYGGKIYVKGNNFYMQYNGTNNIIPAKTFKMAFQNTFYKVYEENIYPVFELNSLSSEQAETVCIWLNPALEDLKIDGYEEYKHRLADRFCKGGKNYSASATNMFRFQLRNTLMDIEPQKRDELISYIKPFKILNFKDLVDLHYYSDVPKPLELQEFREENGEFSEETKQALAELSCFKLSELKKSKHKVSHNKVKNYTQYIPSEILIKMAEWGEIPYEYLEYSDVNKQDIFNSQYEVIISVLENMDKYPEKLRITSQDILDEYGKSVNGSRFFKLAMYGYVESNRVIDVASKNKVLRLSGEPEENLFDEEEIKSFYSSTKLAEMFFRDEIDLDFIRKYKELLNDREAFERKSELAIEQIKQKIMTDSEIQNSERDDRAQKAIIEAYKVGLCTPEVLKQNMSAEYLERQYLEGNISDENILNLYKAGVVGFDIIKNYFSEREIFDLYLSGDMSRNAISSMKNTDERNEEILEAVMDGRMPLSDVFYLYLNNTLTIEELEDATEFSQTDFDFSTCIDENTDFSKIKEMFERKIIDYNCVTNLKDVGIISDKQLEELKETMDKEKFFDNLKGKTFKLVSDREAKERATRIKRDDKGVKPRNNESEKYSKEKELISKILGLGNIDANLEEYATIESYNHVGKPTSLNGYKIFGSRENGLVIFARFQRENAVFIMPFYQAAYFLNSRRQENSQDVVIEDRMKDKAYLKTLNQVAVVPHTEHFARNLSLAACKLSPEFEERFRGDEKYKSEVQGLCQEMRREYRVQKGLDEK